MLNQYPIYATLPASDIGRAKRFYEGTLGLSILEEREDGILFEAGGTRVFVYSSQFAGTNQATAANWEVDDIEKVVSALKEAGVTFEEYDFPGLKTTNGIAETGTDRGAWFKDTEGNILALVQRGS